MGTEHSIIQPPDIIVNPTSSLYICSDAEYLLLESIKVGTAVELTLPQSRHLVKLYGLAVAYCLETTDPRLIPGHFYSLDNLSRQTIEAAFDAGEGKLSLNTATLGHVRGFDPQQVPGKTAADLLTAASAYHLPSLPQTIDLGHHHTPWPLTRREFRLVFQTNPSGTTSSATQYALY